MERTRPPDGGYGWVIVFAYAFNNMIVVPITQGFGLLFRNVFQDLQMSALDISTIINVNSAFGLLLGIFNGPILKRYSFRQVAFTGTLLTFIGFLLTSTASTFKEFMIYYGIIHSLGFCITSAAYNLALNSYFIERRNLASGLCTAVTGLGPVFIPIIISFLIGFYGVRGTSLILAGFILNTLAGSLLLQPVSWHYCSVEEEKTIEKELELLNPPIAKTEEKEDHSEEDDSNEELDIHSVHGLEKVMIPSKKMENAGGGAFASRMSLHEKAPDATWWRKASNSGIPPYTSQYSIRQMKKKKKTQKWTTKIVKMFDLDLLQDPGYRTIWLGMSIAFTGEINFSLMIPLILGDKGWDVQETASIMSSYALADIIMRFISPFIGDLVKLPAKFMYMISLIFLVITRSTIIFVNGWTETVIAFITIGLARGLRTVYMGLVIPSYVPLEKLASASGLQTVLNGIFLLTAGPILGYIRDKSGNYSLCVWFLNSLSLFTVILWTIEFILDRRKLKPSVNQTNP